ncbi:hypothetical protein [Acinetobacter sp. YH01006]|uniref:hypothetical protein n=1 Tax=Acinetobacter sp. YH01006 TaxID=2601022 RepID=UPI0015D26F49|nr:hypothetical protein [Acinetobacter sp. YH01006]
MPLPTAAELTDPTATNTQMKQRLGQLAENVESKESSTEKANTAKNEAIVAASTDATTKANTAEVNAKTYTDTAKAEAVSDAINSFYNVSSNRKDLFQINDDNFNVLLSIDKKGNLLLPQSNMPVQNALGAYPELKTKTRLPQEGLQPISSELMSYLPFSGVSYAPCPLGLQPQRYSINPVDLGGLKVGIPVQIPLSTYYSADDSVVHPSIVEFYGGFRGYRYLLAITSYATASVENPSIFGSNDLETFDLLDGFVQPLALPTSNGSYKQRFLSDVNLSYDPINGLIVCTYRDSATDPVLGSVTALFARTTRDGYEWSDPITLSDFEPDSAGGKKLSPSLIYNPTRKKWMLWSGTGSGMRLRTSDKLDGNWTIEHTKRYDGRGIWHHEVRYVGGLFVMLTSNSEGGNNFEFLTSMDGENWTYRGEILPEDQAWVYKPSFLVNLNEDKSLNLTVLWTDNNLRKLFIGKTNSINYEVA